MLALGLLFLFLKAMSFLLIPYFLLCCFDEFILAPRRKKKLANDLFYLSGNSSPEITDMLFNASKGITTKEVSVNDKIKEYERRLKSMNK